MELHDYFFCHIAYNSTPIEFLAIQFLQYNHTSQQALHMASFTTTLRLYYQLLSIIYFTSWLVRSFTGSFGDITLSF
jgi:hypothetical protein